MTIPYVADCAGYHLLGGSEAASVANIVNPAKPLVRVGTPTYPAANYALCNFKSELQGFRTTDSFNNRGFTAMVMCTFPRNAAGTAYATGLIYPISYNSGAVNLRWLSSTQHLLRQGTPPTFDLDIGVDPFRRPTFNPDNDPGIRVFGPHRYALHCISGDASQSRLTMQEAYQIKEFTGPAAQAELTTQYFFGGQTVGGTRDAVFRIAAIAYFTRNMPFAEVSEVWEYISADLQERGL
jgi:hypothetical protein